MYPNTPIQLLQIRSVAQNLTKNTENEIAKIGILANGTGIAVSLICHRYCE